ncbi:hypothetical protein E0H89_09185 [Acinetobacter sp. ANC 3781]|uniref:hypothetical protein n=1 Tax=Acinetobacter sp. ANC 3781 TaxID=2529835 RepID=UPI00103C711F|nr:hypothetical protein [Acinetobacter sp. ANC 3781]TCB77398.1 hypothetical protein E0H89_09185 [Acinetobacter sp. ANC 3781]
MNKRELILLITLFTLIAFFVGKWIPFEDQKNIFENITSTTSIIFAILGIWLALFYPDTISKIFNQEEPSGLKKIYENDKNEIFKRLSLSLVIITFILILCILTNFVIFIVKNISIFEPIKYWLRSLFFAYLFLLSIFQIFALICTLLPNSFLEITLKRNKEGEDFAKRNGPVSQKK